MNRIDFDRVALLLHIVETVSNVDGLRYGHISSAARAELDAINEEIRNPPDRDPDLSNEPVPRMVPTSEVVSDTQEPKTPLYPPEPLTPESPPKSNLGDILGD